MFNFLNCINEFSCHLVDDVQDGDTPPLVQLQTNRIPRGLVPLEKLFDRYDYFKETNKSNMDEQVIKMKIGSKESPGTIKINQGCTREERRLEVLLHEYKDVFT
jgi:hypothetical protein